MSGLLAMTSYKRFMATRMNIGEDFRSDLIISIAAGVPLVKQRGDLRGRRRVHRAYYLRPKPILRIIKTMLEDKDVFVRRCREGYEFFKSLKQRKEDLQASRNAPTNVSPAVA